MPIYAYKCESCGHRQDALQKISDPVLTMCPACRQPALVKQVTAAGFQLKGSGWYVTDFRDGGGRKPDVPAEGASGEKASDKPAEKSADSTASTADKTGSTSAAPAPAPAAGPAAAPVGPAA